MPKHSHPRLIAPRSGFFGVIAALPVALVRDLVPRGGRRRDWARRRLRYSFLAAWSALAPLVRLRELVGNTGGEDLRRARSRNPAALTASPDFARRVRFVLKPSGGMFVKSGQIAAGRTDLLSSALSSELPTLQSNVARTSADEVETADRERRSRARVCREVAAVVRLRESLSSDTAVRIPVVRSTLSCERMLAMDEVVDRSVSGAPAVRLRPRLAAGSLSPRRRPRRALDAGLSLA